jgi:hypothetical protein
LANSKRFPKIFKRVGFVFKKLNKIFKTFLIDTFISISSISSSSSAEAESIEGGITCKKEFSFPPIDFGLLTVHTSNYTCSNGCSYSTTFLTLLGQQTVLSDLESCSS